MSLLSRTLAQLRAAGPGASSDADLLARFTGGDGEAFAELVRRHGPLVLGVCRRAAGDDHLAEDAFQATFLLLVQHAGRLRVRGTLAGWLFTVARRTAARSARREKRVRAAAT